MVCQFLRKKPKHKKIPDIVRYSIAVSCRIQSWTSSSAFFGSTGPKQRGVGSLSRMMGTQGIMHLKGKNLKGKNLKEKLLKGRHRKGKNLKGMNLKERKHPPQDPPKETEPLPRRRMFAWLNPKGILMNPKDWKIRLDK